MNDRISARLRVAAATAVALVSIFAARAQENGAGKSASSGTPDAIAGAKKDFESIKSVRDDALLPNRVMPRVSLPEFHGPVPQTPPVGTAPKTKSTVPEAKSSNWLVDAMQKQESLDDPRGRDARFRDRRSSGGQADEAGVGEQKMRNAAQDRTPRDEGEMPVVTNPLTRYLGEWMTPQDYALLKPGLTKSLDRGGDVKNSTAMSTTELGNTVTGLNDFAFGAPPSTPTSFASPVQRENPYLQSLKPESNGSEIAAIPKSVALPPTRALMPMTIVSPPQTTPAPAKIPEFAKPSTDEKYFKQLKRF